MTKKNFYLFILILAIILPVVIPLFTPFTMGTADGLAHKFRLIGFHESINQGNIRPRWIGEAALGFGAPIFLCNYSLPYYIADIFLRMGFSVTVSTEILQALTLVLSFLFMFFLGRKLWGSLAGLIAGAVYLYAPYHLFILYSYEAWGEMTSYIFPPLILYLILSFLVSQKTVNTFEREKDSRRKINRLEEFLSGIIVGLRDTWQIICITVFLVLFILSHNISAMITIPVILLLGWMYSFAHKKLSYFIWIIWAFISALLCSAFFVIPSVTLSKLINFSELISNEMNMRGTYFKPIGEQIVTAIKVIKTGYVNYYEFTVGLPIILAGFVGLVIVIHQIRKNKNVVDIYVIIGLIMLLLISLFLANPISTNIWNIQLLHYLVYPYRFLYISTFAGSLLSGWVISNFFGVIKFKNFRINRLQDISTIYIQNTIKLCLVVLFITLIIISGLPYTKPHIDKFLFPNDYFSTTQTLVYAPGTLKNMAIYEFLPIYADVNFLKEKQNEFFQTGRMPDKFEVNELDGHIINKYVSSENMELNINANKDFYMSVNTLYFVNWVAYIDNVKTPVNKDIYGRIVIFVPKGIHRIELKFGYVKEEIIGYIISSVGLLLLFITVIRFYKSKYNLL